MGKKERKKKKRTVALDPKGVTCFVRLPAARFAVDLQRCSAPSATRSGPVCLALCHRPVRGMGRAELRVPPLQRGRPPGIHPLQAARRLRGWSCCRARHEPVGRWRAASQRPLPRSAVGKGSKVCFWGKILRGVAACCPAVLAQAAACCLNAGKNECCAVRLKFSILENSLRLIYFSSLCLKLYCIQ